MRFSRRFINFALLFSLSAFPLGMCGCQGRTVDNMEPTGDTVEVVIMQTTNVE